MTVAPTRNVGNITKGGEIPEGWIWATLGEVADTNRKRSKPGVSPDMPFIGLEHVESHTMRLLGTIPARNMRSAAESFEPGDVLYGRLRPYLNKVYCPDFQGLCSAEFIVFRKVPHLINRYLQYFLNSWGFVSFATHLNEGDRPRVSFDQLADYPFPLSPVAEQERIVAEIETQFTRLDAGVAALKRAQANLKRYRAAVLKAACAGSLVPQDLGDYPPHLADRHRHIEPAKGSKRAGRLWGAGFVPSLTEAEEQTLPEGWIWTKVRDLGPGADEVVQVGPMSMRSQDFEVGGVPVLNVGCVQWGRIDEGKLNFLPPPKAASFERYRIRAGDILFTRSGTVGRSAVATKRQETWLMTFHLLRVRTDPQMCIPDFLRIVFEGAPHIRRQTRDASVGTTRAGFNTNLLASLDVPLPPLAEQERIVAEVERRLSVVQEQETIIAHSLKRAERLRQAILAQAFAGNLVPHDPADEPARVLLDRIRAQRARDGGAAPKGRRRRNGDAGNSRANGAGIREPLSLDVDESGAMQQLPLPVG